LFGRVFILRTLGHGRFYSGGVDESMAPMSGCMEIEMVDEWTRFLRYTLTRMFW
jgi:hypothetical protein